MFVSVVALTRNVGLGAVLIAWEFFHIFHFVAWICMKMTWELDLCSPLKQKVERPFSFLSVCVSEWRAMPWVGVNVCFNFCLPVQRDLEGFVEPPQPSLFSFPLLSPFYYHCTRRE